MAPLQRRLEGGPRQDDVGAPREVKVSELAWERARLPTCFGRQGCSDGFRGASNVLVSCRPAQGGYDEHMRRTEQTDVRGAS